MKKREIETYMDAFMEGFWQCYDMMMDMIDDDEVVNSFDEIKRMVSEIQPIVPNMDKPKEDPKPESKPRTGTNVPEPKTVPHAPERQKIQKIDRGKVCALLDAGWKVPKIAGEMHASEATIYNIQKEYREQKAKQEGQAQA